MLWLGIVMDYMWYTVHCFLRLFCQMLFCFKSACYNINQVLCDKLIHQMSETLCPILYVLLVIRVNQYVRTAMLWLGIVMDYMWYTVHCFLRLFCQMLFCFKSACYNIEPACYIINWNLCDNALSARNFLASNMCCLGFEYDKPVTTMLELLCFDWALSWVTCDTLFIVFCIYFVRCCSASASLLYHQLDSMW